MTGDQAALDVLDVAAVAKQLHLSTNMIYDLVRERSIPHHRVGRRVLFERAEVLAWWPSTVVPLAGSSLAASLPVPSRYRERGRTRRAAS